MITKDQPTTTTRRAGLLLLVIALATGWWLLASVRPSVAGDPAASADAPVANRGPFLADAGVTDTDPELPTLELHIEPRHAAALQKTRDHSLAQGVILQEGNDEVPARVRIGAAEAAGKVRLKGDWTDHIDTDKWSLRIELDSTPLLGMSRFSIQHPKTRGFLMEWLMMAIARREGLLAPRATFVNVVINDRPSGVYYLEEHFTKELLESQGRRDGPIVRFGENTLWTTWLQYEFRKEGRLPLPVAFAATEYTADIGAFNERRLARVKKLNDRLHRALAKMRDLQLTSLSQQPFDRLTTLQALVDLQGRTIDGLFVADKLGCMLALYSLIPADHGLAWHALRFYHDPVLDRLEPVLFNTGARLELPPRDLAVLVPHLAEIARSDAVYEHTFASLARMSDPSYVPAVLTALGGELERYARALRAEGLLAERDDVPAIVERLRRNSAQLHDIVRPRDPANFACRLLPTSETGDDAGLIEVEAWATTRIPVAIEAFRFGNGRELEAGAVLASEHASSRRSPTRVVLPRDGRHVRFRFAADARLVGLRNVERIKQAIRQGLDERDRNVDLEVFVRFRTTGLGDAIEERLPMRRVDAGAPDAHRPAAPSLREALERHACLAYSIDLDRLYVRPGSWDIAGDLVVPEGYQLAAAAGSRLRFAPGAVLLTSAPLEFRGLPEHPVILEAATDAGWGGVVVVETTERSRLEHVVIRAASEITRGGWQTTGGVTFYRAPVDLIGVRIENARGEDALNVFGADISLTGCTFDGGVSDLVDGDFVTGAVRDCMFRNSGGDALDFSGSTIVIERSKCVAIGDKALSLGERTRATIRDCTVQGASIGLAVKDLSEAEVDGLSLAGIENYGIAAFVKKPAFGPSSATVRRLAPGVPPAPNFVQQGCRVSIDGREIAGQVADIKRLYEQGVLGK